MLKDRPENYLLANIHSHKADIKYPGEMPLYLARYFFFFKSTTFRYAQSLWAAVNHSQSGYSPNAKKH